MSTSSNPDLSVQTEPISTAKTATSPNLLDRILKQLSSVRNGVAMLILMIILSMTGMLIMQVNVDGFAEYYATLTPSQQALYTDPILRFIRNVTGWELAGWNIFSLVDIYKSYVFITLLAVVSLNIILASLDHFPGAWRYITRKKLSASKPYVLKQSVNATIESDESETEPLRIAEAARAKGFTPTITYEPKRTVIFAERSAWNRLGAYFVHIGLLTIFFGGFLTWRAGHVGSMTLEPGSDAQTIQSLAYDLDRIQTVNFALPFQIECTDIQQTLLDENGSLEANNTVDWFTRFTIYDGDKVVEAESHMNKPFDYRGYRFFQASYMNVARARTITLAIDRPTGPEEVSLRYKDRATLSDGTTLAFVAFSGDPSFANGQISDASPNYRNPAAFLSVTKPGQTEPSRLIAFTAQGRANASPAVAEVTSLDGAPVVMTDFERVGQSHTLSVQYDPGAWVFYIGSVILIAALMFVFFLAHQRIWFVIETDKDGKRKVFAGGSTNRNRPAFERTFNEIVAAVTPPAQSSR